MKRQKVKESIDDLLESVTSTEDDGVWKLQNLLDWIEHTRDFFEQSLNTEAPQFLTSAIYNKKAGASIEISILPTSKEAKKLLKEYCKLVSELNGKET